MKFLNTIQAGSAGTNAIDTSGNWVGNTLSTSKIPSLDASKITSGTFDVARIPSLSATYSVVSHTHTFASLTSKPTTLSGYGITDAATSTHTHTFASITSKPTTLSGYGITDAATSAQGAKADTAYGWGNHSGLYLPVGGGTLTGDLNLNYGYPRINFYDSDDNSDYSLINSNGSFSLYDITNNVHRLWVSSTGNVGIGTTSPSNKLTVYSDETDGGIVVVRASNPDQKLYLRGGIGSGEGRVASQYSLELRSGLSGSNAYDLTLSTASGEALRVDATNNNVGIGTSSPLSKLQVRAGLDQNFRVSSGTNLTVASINDADTAYAPITFRASTFDFQNGNVGIGITTPAQKLHVVGNASVQGTAYSYASTNASYYNSTANALFHQFESYWNTDAANSIATLRFDVGTWRLWSAGIGDSVVTVKSTGNVGIGTTSPSSRLHVNGSAETLYLEGASNYTTAKFRYGGASKGEIVWYEGNNSFYLQNLTGGAIMFYQNGNESLRINTGGNVGIGTASPAEKLTVAGTIQAVGGTSNSKYVNVYVNDSWAYYTTNAAATYMNSELRVDTGLIGSYDEALQLRTAGTTRIYADTSGNVGIGTTIPSTNLHVAGSVRVTGDRIDVNSNTRITGAYYENSNTEYTYIDMYNGGNASINIGTKHALSYISFESGNGAYTERMRITNTGNVGIGTTSPSYTLDVNGNARFSSTVTSTGFVGSLSGNATTATTIQTARTINGTSFNGSANITTANWGTARTITIGATGKSVNGSANVSWSLAEIGAQAAGNYWSTTDTGSVTVEASDIQFQALTVTFQGDVTVQGTFTELSSLRYKENIIDLEPVTDKVSQLRPVRYNKIGTDVQEIGLIAEEVAELFPEVVQYNEDGEPDSLNYTRLSVLLLQTVKELSDRIQKLENK